MIFYIALPRKRKALKKVINVEDCNKGGRFTLRRVMYFVITCLVFLMLSVVVAHS